MIREAVKEFLRSAGHDEGDSCAFQHISVIVIVSDRCCFLHRDAQVFAKDLQTSAFTRTGEIKEMTSGYIDLDLVLPHGNKKIGSVIDGAKTYDGDLGDIS